MIGKLFGILEEIVDDSVLLNVGGVCYLVSIIPGEISITELGAELSLYIHMQVKECEMSLFGFKTYDQKSTFMSLNQVSGVGPKVALGILAKFNVQDIQNALLTKNHLLFKQVPGIGNKLAERIVLELQNKNITKGVVPLKVHNDVNKTNKQQIFNDSVNALMSLGLNYSEAVSYVNSVISNCDNVEDAVTSALKLRATRP